MGAPPAPLSSESDRSHPAPPRDASPAEDVRDSRQWTGDADEQKTELRTHLIGFAIVVALLTPLAVWIGWLVSKAIGL